VLFSLFGEAEQKTFLMIWFFLLDEQKKEHKIFQ